MIISDKTYNVVKWVAQILLPALATLYFALSKLWVGAFPYPEQISGSIMVIDAFLGALLGFSAKAYKETERPELEYAPDPNVMRPYLILERQVGIFIKMTEDTYDKLKWVAQYLLPSLGSLVFALSGIWGLSSADAIVGTIAALDVFLGAILGISTNQYVTEVNSQIVLEKGIEVEKYPDS